MTTSVCVGPPFHQNHLEDNEVILYPSVQDLDNEVYLSRSGNTMQFSFSVFYTTDLHNELARFLAI